MSTGIITTVAGSGVGRFGTSATAVDNIAATSTTLNAPIDVAVDAYGNIYILDTGNHRVRKVTVSAGIIPAIAGSGNGPVEVAFPALGIAANVSTFFCAWRCHCGHSGECFLHR